jgi:hypothetical protein
VQTYLDIVSRANAERIKEVLTMGEFEKILEETGYIARAEARGEVRGRKLGETSGITKGVNAVLNLVRQGLSPPPTVHSRLLT